MNIIAKTETHEAFLKPIFENIRNIGICVAILMAAQWASTNDSNTWQFYSQGIYIVLFITGTVLLLANGLHGFGRIYRIRFSNTWKVLISILYIIIYLNVSFYTLHTILSRAQINTDSITQRQAPTQFARSAK